MILNCATRKWVDFEDMYFDMRGTDCRNPIYFASQGAVTTSNIAVRRCFFQGSNNAGTGCGNGLSVSREPAATVWPTDFVIEDCEFFDNNSHGLFLKGVQNVIVRRCRFYRNGAHCTTGGHGFSMGAMYTVVTSGWTNTPATTIYYRTLGAAELGLYYVNAPSSAYPRMRLTAGTQTEPGVGEFGISGTTIYININASPNSQSITYIWGKCGKVIVEDLRILWKLLGSLRSISRGTRFCG